VEQANEEAEQNEESELSSIDMEAMEALMRRDRSRDKDFQPSSVPEQTSSLPDMSRRNLKRKAMGGETHNPYRITTRMQAKPRNTNRKHNE
jgi:hypothetical protein